MDHWPRNEWHQWQGIVVITQRNVAINH